MHEKFNAKEFLKICKKAEKLIEKHQKESDKFESEIELMKKFRKNEMN